MRRLCRAGDGDAERFVAGISRVAGEVVVRIDEAGEAGGFAEVDYGCAVDWLCFIPRLDAADEIAIDGDIHLWAKAAAGGVDEGAAFDDGCSG